MAKRGRPRKNPIDTNAQQDGSELLNQQIETFASSLRQQINQLNAINQSPYLTPQIGQDYLQGVNLTSRVPTQKELTQWLKAPHRFQKQLRDAGQYLEDAIMQYQRSVKHLSSLMTFRYDLRPCNELPTDADDKTKFLNSMNTCNNILKKLNIGFQFENINWQLLQEGIRFVFFRENDKFLTLQEIPRDYCYITGRWDLGFTYAIDLTWFDKMVNAQKLAPELYEYYELFIKMREMGVQGKELAQFQYYPVPVEKGWVFVFNPNYAEGTPPLKGVFKDALEILSYKDLLKQKTTLDTWKLIAQQIPYDEKNQKFIIEYNQASDIVNMIQQLLPSGVRTFASMLKPQEINFSQTQNMNNVNGLGESLYWASVGIAGGIFGGENSSGIGLKYSLQSDFGFVNHLYHQYENMVNWLLMLNSRTYDWKVYFYGNAFTEAEDISSYQTLVNTSNMPVSKLFGLCGYEPFEIVPVLQLENELGIKDMMKPIIAGSQMSGKDSNDNGRPEKPIEQRTDAGNKTADLESNQKSLKV